MSTWKQKITAVFSFFIIPLLCGGIVMAAVYSVAGITDKQIGDVVTVGDFNSMVKTIKGFSRDDATGYIGINNPNPTTALDIIGDIKVGGIKATNINSNKICNTSGQNCFTADQITNLMSTVTTNSANIVTTSASVSAVASAIPSYSYTWKTAAWSGCSVSACGQTGTQTRRVYCQRSDGVSMFDNKCSAAKPIASQSCSARACHSCKWDGSHYRHGAVLKTDASCKNSGYNLNTCEDGRWRTSRHCR